MRMHAADNVEEAVAALLARMAPGVVDSQANAQRLDRNAGFPADDVAALARAGAIGAVVPTLMGGLGIGTEAARAHATASVLSLIGRGSIALGRLSIFSVERLAWNRRGRICVHPNEELRQSFQE